MIHIPRYTLIYNNAKLAQTSNTKCGIETCLTAKFDYYQLRAVKPEELASNPENTWLTDPTEVIKGRVTFNCKSVPHITLKSIARNTSLDPIFAKHEPILATALVATGFGYSSERRARQGQVVAQLLPQIRDIRRMGAAALDLCSVASGRVDAYYEVGLAMWDLAAGELIATEAGARVGTIEGGPDRPTSVLAAHPALFDPLQAVLSTLGAGQV